MSETAKLPLVARILKNVIQGEKSQAYPLANYANAAALLKENFDNINWAGFYLYDDAEDVLVLGPFIGKKATVLIKPTEGVVGHTFLQQETVIVENVEDFPGHIACDPTSQSEIVVPITTADGQKLGVLDIDAPSIGRFTEADKDVLEAFVQTLLPFIHKIDVR
ncbi:MAG TPA: GAF domain-containing protein [Lactobacillaceae bacterium]|jgi:GAF domain-containing protein